MIYPLVKEMAAVGARVRVPVAVACRVLGFSKQGYYKWLKQPVSAREAEERELIAVLHQLHDDDPEGGYRVLADDITELGYTLSERRVWRLCRVAGIQSVFTTRKTRYKKAGAPVHDDLVNRQFSADGPKGLLTVWLTPRSHDSHERVVLEGWHPCRRSFTLTSSSATRSRLSVEPPRVV